LNNPNSAFRLLSTLPKVTISPKNSVFATIYKTLELKPTDN